VASSGDVPGIRAAEVLATSEPRGLSRPIAFGVLR
jgi:hypothetical protein